MNYRFWILALALTWPADAASDGAAARAADEATDPGATQLPDTTPQSAEPYLLVLGTAQDGGLPQIGCRGAVCEAARSDPALARRVSSLLLVDPVRGRRWLFDAGPDLAAQVEAARGHPPNRRPPGARPPLFEGVFLTHAHIGHYTGLAQLGREAYGATALPVHASPRMCAFLRSNGPWSLLVEEHRITLRPLLPGETRELGGGLSVEALAVPHRDEFSDTLAFIIRGPQRAVLYLPDIDKWERWERSLEDLLEGVDVAYLDGTFYADGEIPGRAMADIPHPFVSETLRLLRARPDLLAKVRFLHLNHTNPAAHPGSGAAASIRAAGAAVARDGERVRLGAERAAGPPDSPEPPTPPGGEVRDE